MRLVACITQTSVIDQILTHLRTRTAREVHERVGEPADARQSVRARSVISPYLDGYSTRPDWNSYPLRPTVGHRLSPTRLTPGAYTPRTGKPCPAGFG